MTRRGWHLSLRVKILSVAGVPVIALVVSATTFLLVLAEANRAEADVAHSIAIRQATSEVQTAFEAVTGSIWGEAFGFGGGEGLGKAQDTLDQRVADLRVLAAQYPLSIQLLSEFEAKVASQVALSQVFVAEMARTHQIPDLSDEVKANAEQFNSSPKTILDQIAETVEGDVASKSMQAEAARNHVVAVVIISSVAGAVLGLALILFAVSGIVRRVRRLGDNARRLASGQQLMPFAHGNDEIGSLAHELEDAAALLAQRESAMRSATDEAERANRAKSEFLSRMSHELRTPLNSILGFGQMLEMSERSEEGKQDVQHIMRAGKHLLVLIDEVLDISGIEAGAVRFSIEPVCVDEVFEEVISLARPIAERNRITLSSVPATDVWVQADRQRFKQVLLNLVVNGVKYNHDGGSVSMSVRSQDGSVDIDVVDSGRGLSNSDIDRLFVPFARLGTDQANIEGTGLGLALSKRLVEGMGGRISVASTVGMGSTFTVSLSAAEASAPASHVPKETRAREMPAGVEPLVLYVEDNTANFKLIERILADSPVRLMSAIKGTLGVELATMHLPDVILLDLHLPDLSGEEVLQRLRADARTANIPVMVISADATPDHSMRSMKPAAFLTKPLDVAEFLEAFDGVMASRVVA
jgi:signal transduction histidine kinase/ActR/RegA family two-component response regulator